MIKNQLILLFSLMFAGYLSNRMGYMDREGEQKISRLLINVAIPATILASVQSAAGIALQDVMVMLLIAAGFYLIVPVAHQLLCKKIYPDRTYELMLTYSNLGFMGIPLVSALFGTDKVVYVTLFMILFNISIFSSGIAVCQSGQSDKTRTGQKFWKKYCNPGILSSVAALICLIADISFAPSVQSFLESMGSVTTPLAMMVIGSSLASVPLKTVFSDKNMYSFSLLKLVVLPGIVLLVLKALRVDTVFCSIVVLLTALPTAGNVAMVCSQYNGNEELAAKGICISTLLSVVTLPVWISIIK